MRVIYHKAVDSGRRRRTTPDSSEPPMSILFRRGLPVTLDTLKKESASDTVRTRLWFPGVDAALERPPPARAAPAGAAASGNCTNLCRVSEHRTLVSDNGTAFTSRESKQFCAINGITDVSYRVYCLASNDRPRAWLKFSKQDLQNEIIKFCSITEIRNTLPLYAPRPINIPERNCYVKRNFNQIKRRGSSNVKQHEDRQRTLDDDSFEGSEGGGGDERQLTNASAPGSATVQTTNTTEGTQVPAASAVKEAELLSPVTNEQESWASPHSGVSSGFDSEYVPERTRPTSVHRRQIPPGLT
ncbi:hypothetical protein EVAR_74101_1 [Eumeta japonica]|uniref:Integrase catalytic domain-containing protein n=1 Tax=Eumeta variegata TaxID=151549 RepID=A0A4C1TF05_EUMVA|nr:hypothetical protein EVAR_74101_1 [Eumeta japonica]